MNGIDDLYKTIGELLVKINGLESRVSELNNELMALRRKSGLADEDQGYEINSYSAAPQTGKRDTTRYLFNGAVYLKNRLVLAVVKAYVSEHPNCTMRQLKVAFDKSLQGSIGVVVERGEAERRADYRIRFFADDDEVIHLIDGDMYVCTQWGILNLPNFLQKAEQLGFDIKPIKK